MIGTVLERGIPVLVGVGPASISAFDSFAGELAITLAADTQAIVDW